MGKLGIETIKTLGEKNEMKIEHLISINGAILMVYYINSSSYKYTIAFSADSVYQPNKIYYTIDKALQAGKESIKIAIGY